MKKTEKIFILPLHNTIIFPHAIIPLFIGKKKSIKTIEHVIEKNKKIIVVAIKNNFKDIPTKEDLYSVGTLSTVLQILRLPDGTIKALIEGRERVIIKNINNKNNKIFSEDYDIILKKYKESTDIKALYRILISLFEKYSIYNSNISQDIIINIKNNNNINDIIDIIVNNLKTEFIKKQKILEQIAIQKRAKLTIKCLYEEIRIAKSENSIHEKIKKQMDKIQQEYYLNEKLKAIQEEINKIKGIDNISEYDKLEKRISKSLMHKEAKEKSYSELQKMKYMNYMSSEANVIRNYIECLLSLPWKKENKINKNFDKVQKKLNDYHFGLLDVKERILEYISIYYRKKNNNKTPIICFIGPPGTGKTSLSISIAKAINRKFSKISLGGMSDEAEIKGHRRTYIGAMPGKIIQKMIELKTMNPVILLDEIDKLSSDFRGNPSFALLEALDPEQNKFFSDHYLEVSFDLSKVMFIATANSFNIPHPLRDRMEIIELNGYSENEKVKITEQFLIKKNKDIYSLKDEEIFFKKTSIIEIIRYYAKESGIRLLNQYIEKICRKSLKQIILKKKKRISINTKNIKQYLGERIYDQENNKKLKIGEIIGLAWTTLGGEILKIESGMFPGKGALTYTGSLGTVMKESIQTAFSLIKLKSHMLNIHSDILKKNDFHIHAPNAIPKDGPSAGVAIFSSILSTILNKSFPLLALTGEISLSGRILPVGGIKEKVLAAIRNNIKIIILPKKNAKDIKKIERVSIKNHKILFINEIDELCKILLQKN